MVKGMILKQVRRWLLPIP